MRVFSRFAFCLGLVFVGYALGVLQFSAPQPLRAEPTTDAIEGPVRDKLRDADRVLSEAMQALQDEKRYVPVILGLNAFATSVGGVDAMSDLESGHGVDPETFAGLYAGYAMPEVAEHLSHDAQGRVTYKNRIVRLYNPSRLKQLFAARAEFAPTATTAAPKRTSATKKGAAKEKEKSEDAEEKPKSE
jgi:hypothetical protein